MEKSRRLQKKGGSSSEESSWLFAQDGRDGVFNNSIRVRGDCSKKSEKSNLDCVEVFNSGGLSSKEVFRPEKVSFVMESPKRMMAHTNYLGGLCVDLGYVEVCSSKDGPNDRAKIVIYFGPHFLNLSLIFRSFYVSYGSLFLFLGD
ncbi:hypothetical protein Ddye_029316 [Dipteronia dyeriana]|uniref:Uncharacterized protein n=1 Tax=Dipteronia dyeriana TaxID=168575 RepID=A0AAD9TE71_9ROSI|nr:hypothetical protein Ddye_029316 [Dipteronia dyeriana]